MFILKNPKTPLPVKMPHVVRHIGSVHEKMWVEVDGKKMRKGKDFVTQEGLQEYIIQREDVDILLLGSQPATGKTFGLLFAALDGLDKKTPGMAHGVLFVKKQLISTKDNAGSITQDAKVLYNFADCVYTSSENPTFTFPEWNTVITFTHANFPDTPAGVRSMQEKFKNFQCARIFIDEATEHNYQTFLYLQSRNRDTSGVVPRMVLTFNVNSWHWTRQVIDWWLIKDPETGMRIADPAKIGKVRYAYFKGDTPHEIVWGDTRQEVIEKGGIVVPENLKKVGIKPEDMVRSVAFRPALMTENMEMLTATQGKQATNVFNLGSTEAKKLWLMDWDAEEISNSNVTNDLVNDIFDNPADADGEKYATLDVSMGGDNCLMIIWQGHTITAIERLDGSRPEILPYQIKHYLSLHGVPQEHLAFDGTGVGEYLKGFVNGRPLIMNTRALPEYDEYGNVANTEQYYNLRSQLLAKTQYMIETHIMACTVDPRTIFPHGRNKAGKYLIDILKEEADVFRSTEKNGKTYYRLKKEFKVQYGYSPDFMDTISYRAIFDIEAPTRKQAALEFNEADYYEGLNNIAW